jgi:hypothetical protein
MLFRTLTEAPRGVHSALEVEEDSSYPSREVSSTPITAATNKVPPTSTLVMAVLAPNTTASRNLRMPRNLPFAFDELYGIRASHSYRPRPGPNTIHQ